MKKEKKKGIPSSDSRIVIHEPNIPRGAAGSEDELGVAFGALCCALVGGSPRTRTGGGTVLGVTGEHGLDAHANALNALDGTPAVAIR